MLIMIIIGYFMEKRHIVGPNFNADLSSFVIKVALPCLIVKSMQGQYSVDELRTCGMLLLVSLLFLAVSFAVGGLIWKLAPKNYKGRTLRFGVIFTNFTCIGIPLTESLYGTQGLFYFVVFLVPIRIALYSMAKPMLVPAQDLLEKPTFAQKLKGWFSPPMVGVIVGLVFYITGWELPPVVAQPVAWLTAVCAPMGMLLCGVSLGKYPAKALLRKSCFLAAALRCLLMPAIFMGLSVALKLTPELARPMVVCSMLPIAFNLATFTIRYETNEDAHFESAGAILCSTVLSVATIPLWCWVLNLL